MTKLLFFMRQANIMILLTIGASLEYISGDFDLAFATQISASSLLGVFLALKGVPLVLSCIAVFGCNALVGALKGFLIVKLHMPSIIVTFGLQMILANLCVGITDNSNLLMVSLKETYQEFPIKEIGFICAILGIGVAYYFLEHTYYGKYCRILGENLNLARINGLKCMEISMLIHVFVSAFFSVPAILLMFYTGSGSSSMGADYLYKVLTAVFLGQNLVGKRKNSILGMVSGALAVVIFTCALTAKGCINRWENILEGIVMLVCLSWTYRKKTENPPPKSENPHIDGKGEKR